MIEGQIDISPIFGLHYVLKSYQVVVSCQSLQVHDLPESALRIGGISKGVKALLEGQHLASSFLNRLPDDAVRLRATNQTKKSRR